MDNVNINLDVAQVVKEFSPYFLALVSVAPYRKDKKEDEHKKPKQNKKS